MMHAPDMTYAELLLAFALGYLFCLVLQLVFSWLSKKLERRESLDATSKLMDAADSAVLDGRRLDDSFGLDYRLYRPTRLLRKVTD